MNRLAAAKQMAQVVEIRALQRLAANHTHSVAEIERRKAADALAVAEAEYAGQEQGWLAAHGQPLFDPDAAMTWAAAMAGAQAGVQTRKAGVDAAAQDRDAAAAALRAAEGRLEVVSRTERRLARRARRVAEEARLAGAVIRPGRRA